MIKMIPNNTNKRHINSDHESNSEEEEWVGPKQSEINEENSSDSNSTEKRQPTLAAQPVIKKRKSNLIELLFFIFKIKKEIFKKMKNLKNCI